MALSHLQTHLVYTQETDKNQMKKDEKKEKFAAAHHRKGIYWKIKNDKTHFAAAFASLLIKFAFGVHSLQSVNFLGIINLYYVVICIIFTQHTFFSHSSIYAIVFQFGIDRLTN